MLQLKNIKKEYITGDLHQTALAGVSLNLRESELVAILGPSGSGKSTLLNIIGGLDQYDSGDLIINGISTKKYTDRDWDSYRNHTVGFVFQSYNLIPHQTVLANVELALTISGVSKAQRRQRAVAALEQVGLGNQLHKKPNQMSGGQMQRVAIARALVNNPSILLADEPTGALDSETSIQVMDLLKEVSKDRLVVMVTHNPELATEYADRIVRVKDGRIIDDSAPFEVNDTELKEPEHKNMGKSSMSFGSALALSFNNLKSKKGRTLLTAFAGSIGIIGIALIMALSFGFQKYIDNVQEDTLANNPLVLQSDTADFMSLMMPQAQKQQDTDAPQTGIEEQPVLSNVFQHIGSNDLAAFKAHLEENDSKIGHTLNAVQYDYGVEPFVYAIKPDGYQQVNPSRLFKDLTGNDLVSALLDLDAFTEIPDNQELMESQYQLLEGHWPSTYDEVVFVLPAPNQISDHLAYTLGMKDLDSLDKMIDLLMAGSEMDTPSDPLHWSYSDLMSLTFQLVSVPDLYQFNNGYGIWEDMTKDAEYMQNVIQNGETLHVVGVVCPQPNSGAMTLNPGIAYHKDLTRHVIEKSGQAQIVKDQLANPEINVFNGKPYDNPEHTEPIDFQDMISIDENAISEAFGIDVSESAIVKLMEEYLEKMASASRVDTSGAEQAFTATLCDLTRQMLLQQIGENGSATLSIDSVSAMAESFLQSDYAVSAIDKLTGSYSVSTSLLCDVYQPLMTGLVTEYVASHYLAELPPEAETQSLPADTDDTATEAAEIASDETVIPTVPSLPIEDPSQEIPYMELTVQSVENLVGSFTDNPVVSGAATIMGKKMMEPVILESLITQAAGFGDELARYFTDSFYVDSDKLVSAFHFNVTESEMRRVMEALSPQNKKQTLESTLKYLGYAEWEKPVAMSFYLKDFNAKEEFVEFLSDYNKSMEDSDHPEQVIRYNDMAAMMMDSVRIIINTVSYVLIAFVAVSLLVSSIMIGIITYISVMERTKEIGVLRAMGASKHNISQVFNAETFIIGLGSGILGVGISLLLLIPANILIRNLMETQQLTAQLPFFGGLLLIIISMLLTLLGGLIPAKQAAKKDPVIALRSE